jgi:predicted dehydrogenase
MPVPAADLGLTNLAQPAIFRAAGAAHQIARQFSFLSGDGASIIGALTATSSSFTPECIMNKGNLSRRGFLGRSLAALTAGAGLPLWYAREVLGQQQEQAGQARRPAAGDRIVIGMIGIGDGARRGRQLLGDLGPHRAQVEIAAVCDVDRGHREEGVRAVTAFNDQAGRRGRTVAQHEDFRDLLRNRDINAVIIAVPDHWHTIIALSALRAGKDVYCEKPLTLTLDEGKALARVAAQTNRVFQTGSQQRSDARFRLACELVRNNRIGRVRTVETRIGDNPRGGPFPVSPVPNGLNWDLWQGQTPRVDFVTQRCHYEFRWWYEYSGGKMTDWGAHHNDIAQWGLGMDESGPVAVEGTGAAPDNRANCYNCHPTFTATYTYANGPGGGNGTVLRCTNAGENGIRFEGDDGKWIFVSRGRIGASDRRLLDEPLPQNATRLYVSNNHMGNFLQCIRSRRPTICPASVGYRSVSVCHLGNIAIRSGLHLRWDPENARFTGENSEAGNRWLSRPMRAPWDQEYRRLVGNA